MDRSNETLGTVNDWSKPPARDAAKPAAGTKSYAIPFKALLRGALTVNATSKKAAVTQARQLLKNASLAVNSTSHGAQYPLTGVEVKKQSVKTTKK